MAHLCVAACGKINGVSQLHGNILKTQLFRDSYIQHPSKFLAITNGITHRRWLAKANPGLTKLMIDYIGDGFLKDYTQFERLMEYQHDEKFRERFFEIKQKTPCGLCVEKAGNSSQHRRYFRHSRQAPA